MMSSVDSFEFSETNEQTSQHAEIKIDHEESVQDELDQYYLEALRRMSLENDHLVRNGDHVSVLIVASPNGSSQQGSDLNSVVKPLYLRSAPTALDVSVVNSVEMSVDSLTSSTGSSTNHHFSPIVKYPEWSPRIPWSPAFILRKSISSVDNDSSQMRNSPLVVSKSRVSHAVGGKPAHKTFCAHTYKEKTMRHHRSGNSVFLFALERGVGEEGRSSDCGEACEDEVTEGKA